MYCHKVKFLLLLLMRTCWTSRLVWSTSPQVKCDFLAEKKKKKKKMWTPRRTAMSRRCVSVRELGVADCQGWLQRRKEGRSFLGSNWRRYWFVLKGSSLYWYTDKTAEKAEGFINLPGFTIREAKESRKKHAITATHPLVVTIFIAAENISDMNKWITKLSDAAQPGEAIDTKECYSEGSDQDADESPCPQDLEPETRDSGNVPRVQPRGASPPCASENANISEGGTISRTAFAQRRLFWAQRSREAESPPMSCVTQRNREQEVANGKQPEEMGSLYRKLQGASFAPMGLSNQRDFRASFVTRSPNDVVNEKVHRVRILRSTLKAKECELMAVDQVLIDPALTASRYRKWKDSNMVLLQELRRAAGGARRPQTVDE